MPTPKPIFMSIRMPEATRTTIRELAAVLDRSQSDIIRRAVERYARHIQRRRAARAQSA